MPDPVDRLPSFIESTRRFCSLFGEWICSLTFRHSSVLGNKEEGNHSPTLWKRMEPIDISSSDSDFDSDDDLEVLPLTEPPVESSKRKLPNWGYASQANAGNEGFLKQQRKLPSPKRGSIGGATSSSAGNYSLAESGPSTSYGIHGRAMNSHVHRGAEFRLLKENGNTSHESLRRNDSAHARNAEYEPPTKRFLPVSLQPSGARPKQSSGWGNVGSFGTGDIGPSGRGRDEEYNMYDNNRARILPQSLIRGSNDPLLNMGFGEERVDERLIYQAALQDLSQPKNELDIPAGLLSVPLLRHQKIALAWMVEKESRNLHCLGGILADDQGLGKTISTIALIQHQRSMQMKSQSEEHDSHKAEALNLDDDDDDKGTAKNKIETLNLDDDDGESASMETAKKEEDLNGPKCSSGAASSSRQTFQRRRPAAGTLIVCPATVLRQWARELDDKVAEEGKLSVLVYHGGTRTKDPIELAKYDVVLTTYSIVSNEVPKQPIVEEDEVDGDKYGLNSDFSGNNKRKNQSTTSKKGKKGKKLADSSLYSQSGALAKVAWFRVVLDEAQTIKNHRTQTARACCGLRAKRRWCLSGTPIQNSIDEVYSYFRFLRHHLYSLYGKFCEAIKLPISRDPNMGYKKLQAVLKTLLLRRTKETLLDGEPIITLPPKVIQMKTVNFTREERAFYAQLEAESRSQFKEYAAAGTVNQNYANILLMILRLRQACDHPLLVKGFSADAARRTNLEQAKKLPKRMMMDLLNKLEASSSICLICNDPAEDAVIAICGHVFCYQCVADYFNGDDNLCPARRCKEPLSDDVVFSETTLRRCLSGANNGNVLNDNGSAKNSLILSSEYSSSKIKAALEILLSHCNSNSPCIELDGLGDDETENSMCAQVRTHKTENSSSQGPIKTIVFSQWTRMLDLFEFSLSQHLIQYRRLDGSMSLAARDRAVREFNTDPEVTVMLMSLKAGNLGLNMVAACHVILLDLWWNPTTEDQAIDRAHRIGQTRAVTVSRITVKDTVEDRILSLQEEKRKMVASAFGEDRVGGIGTRLTVDDLRYLFLGTRSA